MDDEHQKSQLIRRHSLPHFLSLNEARCLYDSAVGCFRRRWMVGMGFLLGRKAGGLGVGGEVGQEADLAPEEAGAVGVYCNDGGAGTFVPCDPAPKARPAAGLRTLTGNYRPEIGGYSELPSTALSWFQSRTAPVVVLKRSSWVTQAVPLNPRLVILFITYLSQCVHDR